MDRKDFAETIWLPEDVVRIAKENGKKISYEKAREFLDHYENDIQIAQMKAGEQVIRFWMNEDRNFDDIFSPPGK
jgi:hypothetical protein